MSSAAIYALGTLYILISLFLIAFCIIYYGKVNSNDYIMFFSWPFVAVITIIYGSVYLSYNFVQNTLTSIRIASGR